MSANGTCPNCGGPLHGDGWRTVLHCEFADIDGIEPDARPVFCTTTQSIPPSPSDPAESTFTEGRG